MTEQEKYNTFNVLEILKIDNRTEEIIASSALEGEELDKVQVENSVIKLMLEDKINNLDIELNKIHILLKKAVQKKLNIIIDLLYINTSDNKNDMIDAIIKNLDEMYKNEDFTKSFKVNELVNGILALEENEVNELVNELLAPEKNIESDNNGKCKK